MTGSRILVTGGTGALGSRVVPRLRDAGHEIRVLSRTIRQESDGIDYVSGDLARGEGIEEAVRGSEIIVHLAGSQKGDEIKTRHLVEAATRAGVRHLVYISVVGADTVPVVSRMDRAMFGYFASKFDSEQIVATSGLPWTTLRATQFHDLTFKTVQGMAKMPVIPVPSGFRFQPIDAGEVADRLVDLALGAPAGMVPEMGGPHTYDMEQLVRGYLWAINKYRPIIRMRMPGGAARAFREGANLVPERAVGRRTWEEFLDDTLGSTGEAKLALA